MVVGNNSIYMHAHIRHLVGIVANQGDLDEKSSIKGAHFIRLCSLRDIPLVFLVNTPSDPDFLSSHGSPGLLAKARAQMMATLATSSVPKITIACGGSYGPSAYAMVSDVIILAHLPILCIIVWQSNAAKFHVLVAPCKNRCGLIQAPQQGASKLWRFGVRLC